MLGVAVLLQACDTECDALPSACELAPEQAHVFTIPNTTSILWSTSARNLRGVDVKGWYRLIRWKNASNAIAIDPSRCQTMSNLLPSRWKTV